MKRMVIGWLLVAGLAAVSAAQPVENQEAVESPRVVSITGELELDDIIDVGVAGLADWAQGPGHSAWRLVPYINGRALPGVYPVAVDLRTGKLQFHLRMTAQNRDAWTQLLSPPVLARRVGFSVGLELQDAFATDFSAQGRAATLVVVEAGWMVAVASITLLLGAGFLRLALSTSILREQALTAAGHGAATVMRFSLGKVQLAVWFFIVFIAFITVWLATGNYDTINGSIVALMGISAGTAVGDSYIRSGVSGRARRRDAREARKRRASAELADAADVRPGRRAAHRSTRFFRDLLTDQDGYSIFRFQMLAWTLVLNVVFISNVYYNLAIPEFRPDLLYLMGLSSGTYIAHRYPEVRRETELIVYVDPAPSSKRDTEENP